MIPQALLQSLANVKGFNEQLFIDAHQTPSPTSVRLNKKKSIKNFDSFPNVKWCNHAFYLPERPSFTYSPEFHAGCYYVQEASSMFLSHVLKQITQDKTIETALDLCAAPGGKSTLLLDELDENCLLVSNEVISNRASILIDNLNRWGRINNVVTNNDTKKFSSLNSFFDLILIDAPCSGSGLFRKDKEAINEWSVSNVEMCSTRQSKIVDDVMPALSGNGYLIYSTCSFSSQENENMLDYIIENHGLESVQIPMPDSWGIIETRSDKFDGYGYRFYPDKLAGEGFFIAVFKQNSGTNHHKKNSMKQSNYTKLATTKFAEFVSTGDSRIIVTRNDFNCCILKSQLEKIDIITSCLTVKKVGVEVGNFMHNDFIPTHALALSEIVNSTIKRIELNESDAIKYLKKESVSLVEDYTGWAIATYYGFALGWMKLLKNRMNNYYPKSSRILH